MIRRMTAITSAAGFVWFLASAVGIQLVHPDGWARVPISAYLTGAHSAWLQAAYYVLALALVLLGARVFSSNGGWTRRAVWLALCVAGCSVALIAYTSSPWPLPGHPSFHMRRAIHVASAFTAFLCVTIVMFFETPFLWRGRQRRVLVAYALSVLLVEVAASVPPNYAPGIHGALEKLAIAGLVVWLAAAAVWHAAQSGEDRDSGY